MVLSKQQIKLISLFTYALMLCVIIHSKYHWQEARYLINNFLTEDTNNALNCVQNVYVFNIRKKHLDRSPVIC